jgi:hypothetical protein
MSVEAESMSDMLSGVSSFATTPSQVTDVKAAPSAAAVETPKVEAVRDESGKFAAKVETPVEPAKVEAKVDKPEPMVPLSALLAERAKRREPEAKEPAKVSIFDDEDAGVSQRVDEQVRPLKERLFEMSMETYRERHDDFDKVAESFTQAAEKDPRLWESMRNSANPGKYIYQVGKQIHELAVAGGDVVKYGELKSAEAREQLAAQKVETDSLKAQVAELQKQLTNLQQIPSSLNKIASASPTPVVDEDDAPITKLVRFGNK